MPVLKLKKQIPDAPDVRKAEGRKMTHVSVEPSVERSTVQSRIPVSYPETGECTKNLADEELVEKILKGDEDAFRCLYDKYRRPVYAAVCRIIPDCEEARDATQEIFMAVYRSLRIWSPQRAGLLPWIYRIATNCAIDHWRTQRRRAELQWFDELERHSSGRPLWRAGGRAIERTLEYKERVAEVRRFLEELSPSQRRFFILRYFDELKLREIAAKERTRIGTVKSSLHRATKTMRSRLKTLGIDWETIFD
jgi:RNA polymerase sigma-70 factor (ECF subfamily)